MEAAVIAIASVVAAALTAVLAYMAGQARLKADIAQRQQTKEEQSKELLSRHRDPLLRAAFDLQSRLYNMVELEFLPYLHSDEVADREYALESTLYVVAEYLGWVERLRDEVQFLDLGTVDASKRLRDRLDAISEVLLTDKYKDGASRPDPMFRLFRVEQRAIGEIMLVNAASGERRCLGYAAFVARRANPAFSKWFTRLQRDIEALGAEPDARPRRIVDLQHALIDLLDELDPVCERFPPERRAKIAPEVERDARSR